jgi:dimethylamine monooxygenase subunit A
MQTMSKFKYHPFAGARPFEMRMGLQPLPAEHWIDIDDAYCSQLAAKRALLQTHHGDVFQALPGAELAAAEALQLVLDHLRKYHSDRFKFERGQLRNVLTGDLWDFEHSGLHPLDQAGRLVQEDFCILQPVGDNYRLTAAAVCFPSNWRLTDKIGRPLAEVHGPVPGYADKLEKPVDTFFANLSAGAIMGRANWLIHTTPVLFQVAHAPATETITGSNAGETLWLRVERQTLRRLPKSGAVLFTIRTHLTQLGEAISSPENARDLAVAVRTMPDAVLHYRHMAAIRSTLLDWLDGRGKL